MPGASWRAIAAAAEATAARGQGRVHEARQAVRDGLRVLDERTGSLAMAELALLGLSIEADAAAFARTRGDVAAVRDALDAAAELAARARSALAMGAGAAAPWHEALEARLTAELARSTGARDPDAWERAMRAADATSDLGARVTTRLELAGAILDAGGDRVRAAELLRAAFVLADEQGADPLTAAIDRLARRARIALRVAPHAAGADGMPGPRAAAMALGLSDREVDVLELLALGRTDREIARELFITEKTAGHHVSHILTKLTVTRRGEAAAVAHRLGLVGPSGPVPNA